MMGLTQDMPLTYADMHKWIETDDYFRQRKVVNGMINDLMRVNSIDPLAFKKTTEEKIQAINAKYAWKKEMKRQYGEQWRKYNNPEGQLVS